MTATSIEWTDATWNPVRGCARVSPGCENCYAERQAHRFSGAGQPYEGLTVLGKHGPRWAGTARFVPEMLDAPLRWKKPRRIFVNSMSDLFHEDITNEQIATVFAIMASANAVQHTFQILTKRPGRMLEWFWWADQFEGIPCSHAHPWSTSFKPDGNKEIYFFTTHRGRAWPLPNVWLGVSCEDQRRADERIPLLLKCPAAVRFVSAEPLLGPIDVRPYLAKIDCRCCPRCGFRTNGRESLCPNDGAELGADVRVDWVIAGGESGPGARACDVAWLRSIVAQCRDAGTACFVKQLGATIRVPDTEQLGNVESGWSPYARTCVSDDNLVRLTSSKGGDPTEWPDDLRVRQMPEVRP